MADTPTSDSTIDPSPSGRGLGDRIGPYRLLSVIGEGGFGVVYLAERREPHVQRVAIKVIKPGMDSQAVVARFEHERQALAVMDHPNVARVFDGGATAQGRPYFVMEYVKGEPITTYADRARLGIRERLALFVPVCEAIQHAHHKGVIHRDIKPSNVLVALVDGRPTPKVIDFGVAKSINPGVTAHTMFTEQGVMIGTPEYMSPEQADLGALDVDARTDVYSLGVLLYELLTGTLPFEPAALRKAGFDEIRRIIREVEPPRPSVRVQDETRHSAELAANRSMKPIELRDALRNELEWIPLRALRKERSLRYRSPADLADDIGAYLEGRPLAAGPVSSGYRLRKFAQRHRLGIGAGAAVALSLIIGLGTAIVFAVHAARDRRIAEARLAQIRSFVDPLAALFGGQLRYDLSANYSLGAHPFVDPEESDRQQVMEQIVESLRMIGVNSLPADAPDSIWFTLGVVDMQRGIFNPWSDAKTREWAEPLLRDVVVQLETSGQDQSLLMLSACDQFSGLLRADGRIEEAEAFDRRAEEIAAALRAASENAAPPPD